jgi:hypothetical protein
LDDPGQLAVESAIEFVADLMVADALLYPGANSDQQYQSVFMLRRQMTSEVKLKGSGIEIGDVK